MKKHNWLYKSPCFKVYVYTDNDLQFLKAQSLMTDLGIGFSLWRETEGALNLAILAGELITEVCENGAFSSGKGKIEKYFFID